MPVPRPRFGQLRRVTCGFAVVIGLFAAGACGTATQSGSGSPATGCAGWPECEPTPASALTSAAPTSAPAPAPAPPPADPSSPAPGSPTGVPPSSAPGGSPDPTQGTPPPAPPDADNVACLQVVLSANQANQQFVNLPVDAELAARVSVADHLDAAAATIESQAATITDPAIQAKVADVAAEMRAVASVLRTGSPIENSTLIAKLTDLQTYCGLA